MLSYDKNLSDFAFKQFLDSLTEEDSPRVAGLDKPEQWFYKNCDIETYSDFISFVARALRAEYDKRKAKS